MRKKDKVDIIGEQVQKTLDIKSKHEPKELEKFIVPLLFKGALFKNSREEFKKEIQDLFDENEVEAMCEDERPDAIETTWNDFSVTFLLNWNFEYDQIYVADYLSKQMTEESPQDLLKVAVKNVERTNIVIRNISKQSSLAETSLYEIFLRDQCMPSYVNSILLSEKILSEIYQSFENTLYFCPFYKDRLYMIIGDISCKMDVLKIMLGVKNEFSEEFSSRVFKYDKETGLSEF